MNLGPYCWTLSARGHYSQRFEKEVRFSERQVNERPRDHLLMNNGGQCRGRKADAMHSTEEDRWQRAGFGMSHGLLHQQWEWAGQ